MPAITATITVRLPERLLERVDEAAARGAVSRNAWLVATLYSCLESGAVEQALEQPLLNVDHPQRPTAKSPAPAEQAEAIARRLIAEGNLGDEHKAVYRQHVPGPNVENVRSSAQAKDFTPYPKGGKR